jgi:hypothetical protein
MQRSSDGRKQPPVKPKVLGSSPSARAIAGIV